MTNFTCVTPLPLFQFEIKNNVGTSKYHVFPYQGGKLNVTLQKLKRVKP